MRPPEPSSRLKATPIRVAAPRNPHTLPAEDFEARPSAGLFRVGRLVVTGSRRWCIAPLRPPPLHLCSATLNCAVQHRTCRSVLPPSLGVSSLTWAAHRGGSFSGLDGVDAPDGISVPEWGC